MAKESVASLNRRMALIGASARLQALEAEVASITRAFPEVKPIAFGAVLGAPRKAVRATAKDGRSNWSAKRKREVSERMKKYWAKRRKGVKSESTKAVSGKAKATRAKD